jgi:hypothetical protein
VAALSLTNSELYLVVGAGTFYPPVIGGYGVAGSQWVLNFTGTNGQPWRVLSSTNVATPLTNWTVVASGTFNGTTVHYTNTTPTDPQRFYSITSP